MTETGGHIGVNDPLEPFGGQAWPRGSGEVEAGFDDDRQDQSFAPITIIQGPPSDTEEPFFPEGSQQAAFRSQGYEGSGATKRYVTAKQILGGSAYGSAEVPFNDRDE